MKVEGFDKQQLDEARYLLRKAIEQRDAALARVRVLESELAITSYDRLHRLEGALQAILLEQYDDTLGRKVQEIARRVLKETK
jgi:hypothetical protein